MTGVLTTSTTRLQTTGADTFPGATNGLRVVAGGLLTLDTDASIKGTDSVVIGGAFTTGGLATGGLVARLRRRRRRRHAQQWWEPASERRHAGAEWRLVARRHGIGGRHARLPAERSMAWPQAVRPERS